MNNEKIAIIGGSIAGLTTAIALHQLGYDITVFERSKQIYEDRGAGIMMPIDLVKELIDKKFIGKDFKSIELNSRNDYALNPETHEVISFGTQKISVACANWLELYNNLLQMAPKDCIHHQTAVTSFTQTDDYVELCTDKSKQRFDYAIFCDGYFSNARHHLFPDLQPSFAGYFIWRGILNRCTDADQQLFNRSHELVFHNKGLMPVYPIPNENDNSFSINWAMYELIDEHHPINQAAYAEKRYQITQNNFNSTLKDYLHDYARANLPPYIRDIILETKKPFTQGVYDFLSPQFHIGRSLLIGDSAAVLRPHAAAGATNAIKSALALQQQIQNHSTLGAAFTAWNKQVKTESEQLFKLARALGNALVTNLPPIAELNETRFRKIWDDAASTANWYAMKK